jgi:hypothetical protein
MALTRVQATPGPYIGSGTAPTRTFTTPPTVGNAIVVAVLSISRMTTGVTDNKGNAYTLANSWTNAGAQNVAIYYCPAITATGATFTLTATFALSTFNFIVAVEVGGVGAGLTVDQSAGQTIFGATTPSTGSTAAVIGAEHFLITGFATGTAQSSITVQSVSPSWTQEAENLTGTTAVAGEIDSRILTGAAGTTQSGSWTTSTNATYVAGLVAFRTSVAVVATAQPFVIFPV